MLLKLGKDVFIGKISNKFNYGHLISFNLHVMDLYDFVFMEKLQPWASKHSYGCNCHSSSYIINSSPPSAPYICQLIGSALVQIMACRLFGAKPLSKPLLGYCQLDPKEQIQWSFNQNTKLFIHENASEISSAKWWPFCPGGDGLKNALRLEQDGSHFTNNIFKCTFFIYICIPIKEIINLSNSLLLLRQ